MSSLDVSTLMVTFSLVTGTSLVSVLCGLVRVGGSIGTVLPGVKTLAYWFPVKRPPIGFTIKEEPRFKYNPRTANFLYTSRGIFTNTPASFGAILWE